MFICGHEIPICDNKKLIQAYNNSNLWSQIIYFLYSNETQRCKMLTMVSWRTYKHLNSFLKMAGLLINKIQNFQELFLEKKVTLD